MTATDRTDALAVEIACIDPASEEAHWCLEQYYAELAERFEEGFELARALYRSAGYREIEPFIDEPYGDFFFEKRLAREAD